MTLASELTTAANAAGIDRSQPEAVFVVIDDGHNTHCLNESMLDAWFMSLSPERKAELYEFDMEGKIRDEQPGVLGYLSTEVRAGFPESQDGTDLALALSQLDTFRSEFNRFLATPLKPLCEFSQEDHDASR